MLSVVSELFKSKKMYTLILIWVAFGFGSSLLVTRI
jgi:hypothetical protein